MVPLDRSIIPSHIQSNKILNFYKVISIHSNDSIIDPNPQLTQRKLRSNILIRRATAHKVG